MQRNLTRIYTDGACSGNPGVGGWSSIILEDDDATILSGGCEHTTNNRMELLGVIKGLSYAGKRGHREVEIHSDSAYVVNAVNLNWLASWKAAGWKRSNGDPVKNNDLWIKLDKLISRFNVVKFVKVKGHSGDTLNEMADEYARREVKKLCEGE